jgi:hypothetical protein
MTNDLTNLLPEERHHTLRREYFWRLMVVAAVLAIALIAAAAILLVPTYLYLSSEVGVREAALTQATAALASSDEAALSARLDALTKNADILEALGNAPSASAVVRSTLSVSRPGVTLTGFTYTAAAGTEKSPTPATLLVSGVSATRDALRNYQIALQGASFVKGADLPVSAFAKDSEIPFTITLTLAP